MVHSRILQQYLSEQIEERAEDIAHKSVFKTTDLMDKVALINILEKGPSILTGSDDTLTNQDNIREFKKVVYAQDLALTERNLPFISKVVTDLTYENIVEVLMVFSIDTESKNEISCLNDFISILIGLFDQPTQNFYPSYENSID